MTFEYRVGDVFARLAEIPDGSIDLLVTSPPFLAQRSYLPADHPDKGSEIGSEGTPAEFIDTLLRLTAEWGRVLAPHGSLCVELGDTFSGSGGAGGDYGTNGLREGQAKFDGSGRRNRPADVAAGILAPTKRPGPEGRDRIVGWPLAKSLCGIPHLYELGLIYGRNLLTGMESPAGSWRARNYIVWARPNPPVGALGDKFRPATSFITVACRSPKRYFDLDAVRTEPKYPDRIDEPVLPTKDAVDSLMFSHPITHRGHPGGAPPNDWHSDLPELEDGDWLWRMATQAYTGSHYATFPLTLPKRLIEAMCPRRVCTTCGLPSTRITELEDDYVEQMGDSIRDEINGRATAQVRNKPGDVTHARRFTTVGWTDCGHDTWRTGIVLDPFAGSGTTLEAAQLVGRHAIGIDFDARNAWLARDRVGMFLDLIGA